MNSKPEIFLSYSHENKEDVQKLYDVLTSKHQFTVWFDKNKIKTGSRIDEKIFDGIVNCKIVICCFTVDYIESEMCVREFKLANHKKKLCLALMIENIDLDDDPKTGFYAVGVRRCLLFENKYEDLPIELFGGDRFEEFINTIQEYLGGKKTLINYDAYLSFEEEFSKRSKRLSYQFSTKDLKIYHEPIKIKNKKKDFECTKNAIDNSTIFICCATNLYTKDTRCMEEIRYAKQTGKPILVLIIENYEKLYNLGQTESIEMFQDKKGEYLDGRGKMFQESVGIIHSLLTDNPQVNKNNEKTSDVHISCDKENKHLIEKLTNEMEKQNLHISYEANQENPNYGAVSNSRTFLAVVTHEYEQNKNCVDELSYANRNGINVTIIKDEKKDISTNSVLNEIIQDVSSKEIFNGEKALQTTKDNPIIETIIEKVELEKKIENKNKEMAKQLLKAAHGNDIDKLALLLKNGANVNDRNKDGQTALMWASSGGHLDVIKYLIEHKANVNDKDKDGKTALIFVSSNGRLDVIKYFIEEHGVNVNDKDKHGETALMWASWNGHLDVIKYLMEHGANVNDKDVFDLTALMKASMKGHLDVIKYFIEKHGANVNDKYKDGKTALMLASIKGHLDVIKYFIEKHGVNVNDKDEDGRTALMWASEKGHLDVIKYLIEHGVNVNDKDKNGETALMWASFGGHLDVIKYFIEEHGVNVNDKDKNGKTALMWAYKAEVQNLLRKHGATD